ncbi:hypothetical protein BVX98_06995 [bacterium F11]|nr:hypothetical protein BVX98_06995 [bacterium F11]
MKDFIVNLKPCPYKPNCVSTLETKGIHKITPLKFNTSPKQAWEHLKATIASFPGLKMVTQENWYLRVEAKSRFFKFIDDVEFMLIEKEKIIHARSTSRCGYTDWGVNKRRYQKIKKQFESLSA